MQDQYDKLMASKLLNINHETLLRLQITIILEKKSVLHREHGIATECKIETCVK